MFGVCSLANIQSRLCECVVYMIIIGHGRLGLKSNPPLRHTDKRNRSVSLLHIPALYCIAFIFCYCCHYVYLPYSIIFVDVKMCVTSWVVCRSGILLLCYHLQNHMRKMFVVVMFVNDPMMRRFRFHFFKSAGVYIVYIPALSCVLLFRGLSVTADGAAAPFTVEKWEI